ncbi:HAD-like protein [Penicillium frequentans]|uniref:HAD-like protein n=1 Tax=Penicillium frequentans TaxID=3151616 RepID=A0AAD6G9E5_9EURO|nr:HAD-like protein [Penicillium glabrum]
MSHNHIKDFGSHGLLSALEIEHIETEVGSLYLEVFGSKLDSIRIMLSAKTWLGFDLDDTLHEFRKASGHASSSVFKAIAEKTPNVTTDELASTYRGILRSKTTGAFTDGRTSEEYRRERFSHLLQAHGSEPTEACLESLTAIYRDSLREALRLKAGSRQLLERLKSLGKKVIVVTEGPQDAQEWTIAELGLQQYIDILITTNEVGKSKVDGLFDIVLDKYNIAASDIVYVGDNEQRDVAPAQLAGIMTVLYDEKSSCRFDDPQSFRINSLPKLGYLVG